MTPTQRLYYDAVREIADGAAVSLTEIARRLDVAKSTARAALMRLVDAGYLERDDRGHYHATAKEIR